MQPHESELFLASEKTQLSNLPVHVFPNNSSQNTANQQHFATVWYHDKTGVFIAPSARFLNYSQINQPKTALQAKRSSGK
jgi:hypothetical protein